MLEFVSDVAFTPAVKDIQERKGSRRGYSKMEEKGGWQDTVTEDLAQFIGERDSFYFGTANADGQPYIQHRGGKPGFLKVLDEKTLAFADFRGNRQYISSGNLSDNDKAYIFLMDYPNRRRIKIWGRARVTEDPELMARLTDDDYEGVPEQAMRRPRVSRRRSGRRSPCPRSGPGPGRPAPSRWRLVSPGSRSP